MDTEAAETPAGSPACCGVLCERTPASPTRLRLVKAFFLVTDLVNLVLDFLFVARLAGMGERGMATLVGAMTCFGVCVWITSKCALSGNPILLSSVVYQILATELLIYVVEDLTTLYVFVTLEGAYDPRVPSSVINLWSSIVCGWLVMVSMWACLLFSRPPVCCCCVLPYLLLATCGTAYFTSFAIRYLMPAESITDVNDSTEHLDMDPTSASTWTYILTQGLGVINGVYILL